MNIFFKFVTRLCLFAAILVSQASATEITGGSKEDRARLAEVSIEWVEAYTDGDLDGIMAIMHPDALVMPHNQPSSRGTDEIRAYFATRIGRPGVKFVDNLQEIRINGSWAYMLGTFKVEISIGPDKPPILHNGRYLIIYEKIDGDWKMLRDMDNLDPVASE